MIKHFITSILSLLSVLLVGTSTSKNSLYRKPTREDKRKALNSWVQMNFGIIALAAVVFLLISFVFVCFLLVGVSATESGTYYYHLK